MSDLLQEGDIIHLPRGVFVSAIVPKHFLYINQCGNWELDRGVIEIKDELAFLAGEYIVTKTCMDGGGSGAFSPNGHHVFCVNSDTRDKVDFYQSGGFKAVIKDITPTGRAKLVWTKEDV